MKSQWSCAGAWRWWPDTQRNNLPTIKYRRPNQRAFKIRCRSWAEFLEQSDRLKNNGFIRA